MSLVPLGEMDSSTALFNQLKDDDEDPCEGDDAVLTKRLSKQRRKAIATARGGRRSISSRNSYKDKGGKGSNNAKIQKQLSKW